MSHHLFRYTLNGLTLLSAVLCVAVVVMCVRSYRVDWTDAVEAGRRVSIGVGDGRLYLVTQTGDFRGDEQGLACPAGRRPGSDYAKVLWMVMGLEDDRRVTHRWGGFRYFRSRSWRYNRSMRGASGPGWLLAGLAAALSVSRGMSRWWRRRERFSPGQCRACGYDLRATPGWCPECGAVPAGLQR